MTGARQVFVLSLGVLAACSSGTELNFDIGDASLVALAGVTPTGEIVPLAIGPPPLSFEAESTEVQDVLVATFGDESFIDPQSGWLDETSLAELELVGASDAPSESAGSCGRCLVPLASAPHPLYPGDRCPIPRFAQISAPLGEPAPSPKQMNLMRVSLAIARPGACACTVEEAPVDDFKLEAELINTGQPAGFEDGFTAVAATKGASLGFFSQSSATIVSPEGDVLTRALDFGGFVKLAVGLSGERFLVVSEDGRASRDAAQRFYVVDSTLSADPVRVSGPRTPARFTRAVATSSSTRDVLLTGVLKVQTLGFDSPWMAWCSIVGEALDCLEFDAPPEAPAPLLAAELDPEVSLVGVQSTYGIIRTDLPGEISLGNYPQGEEMQNGIVSGDQVYFCSRAGPSIVWGIAKEALVRGARENDYQRIAELDGVCGSVAPAPGGGAWFATPFGRGLRVHADGSFERGTLSSLVGIQDRLIKLDPSMPGRTLYRTSTFGFYVEEASGPRFVGGTDRSTLEAIDVVADSEGFIVLSSSPAGEDSSLLRVSPSGQIELVRDGGIEGHGERLALDGEDATLVLSSVTGREGFLKLTWLDAGFDVAGTFEIAGEAEGSSLTEVGPGVFVATGDAGHLVTANAVERFEAAGGAITNVTEGSLVPPFAGGSLGMAWTGGTRVVPSSPGHYAGYPTFGDFAAAAQVLCPDKLRYAQVGNSSATDEGGDVVERSISAPPLGRAYKVVDTRLEHPDPDSSSIAWNAAPQSMIGRFPSLVALGRYRVELGGRVQILGSKELVQFPFRPRAAAFHEASRTFLVVTHGGRLLLGRVD